MNTTKLLFGAVLLVLSLSAFMGTGSRFPFSSPSQIVTDTLPDPDSAGVYRNPDKQPEFPGSDPALRKFLAYTIRYPKEALKKDIQGVSHIGFIVTSSGKLKDFKVVKSSHPLLDEESIRVLSLSPDWIPAEHKGQKADAYYVQTVSYKLTQ